MLALELQKKGDNAAALAEWKKALELDPNDARANNGKLSLANTLKAHLMRYKSNAPLREPPDPVSF